MHRLLIPPAIPAALLIGSGAPAPAQRVTPDTEVVAVIEEWAGARVAQRRVLTRGDFDVTLEERMPGMTFGDHLGVAADPSGDNEIEEEEVRTEHFDRDALDAAFGEDDPAPQPEVPEPAMDRAPLDEGQVVYHELNPIVPEDERAQLVQQVESMENLQRLPPSWRESITEPLSGQSSSDILNRQVQAMALRLPDEDVRAHEASLRRLRRRFEQRVVGEWVERTLIAMEARRRGHSVSDDEVDDALLPMLQARVDQLASERLDVPQPEVDDHLEELQQTVTLVSTTAPDGRQSSARDTLRAEMAQILAEEGTDPDRFYTELRQNLLIDSLIRELVGEVYSDEELRRYHASYPGEFITPPRVMYLSIKHIWRSQDRLADREGIRDDFSGLQRRLRRIDEDVPIDEVRAQWEERASRDDDLPPLIISTSGYRTAMEMDREIAGEVAALEIGETSPVIETRGAIQVVRLIDLLPEHGVLFEEARPRVEEAFFDDTRTFLLQRLREGSRYHIWVNRGGRTLAEALEHLDSPDAPSRL